MTDDQSSSSGEEFADRAWKDEGVIARPLAGTTLTHVAALYAAEGDEMAERYSETLMEHFRDPRNAGCLEPCDLRGVAGTPGRGPFMTFTVRLTRHLKRKSLFFWRKSPQKSSPLYRWLDGGRFGDWSVSRVKLV